VRRARGIDDLDAALREARAMDRAVVIHVQTDREARVGSNGSWWDVPVAEVSTMEPVRVAREAYEAARERERWHL
jgi:3D-(3,5/4)-trihydroxycyclohexane-1,2-dione acylhydrolase (decyclizing)